MLLLSRDIGGTPTLHGLWGLATDHASVRRLRRTVPSNLPRRLSGPVTTVECCCGGWAPLQAAGAPDRATIPEDGERRRVPRRVFLYQVALRFAVDPILILIIAVVVGAVLLLPRILPPRGPICNRCDGSGFINERWPDPSEPTGWHELEGSCPKCKGKGRLRS